MKLAVVLISFIFSIAQAHNFHTPNYCDSQSPNLCGHAASDEQPTVNKPTDLILHLLARTNSWPVVESVTVEMNMPTKGISFDAGEITKLDDQHMQISNVTFLTSGVWLLRATVKTVVGPFLIEIPLEIKD